MFFEEQPTASSTFAPVSAELGTCNNITNKHNLGKTFSRQTDDFFVPQTWQIDIFDCLTVQDKIEY